MSAWSIINGLLGLGVNQGRLRFDPQIRTPPFKLFFALPSGTAHFADSRQQVTIRCVTGKLEAGRIEIRGAFKASPLVAGIRSAAISTNMADGFTAWEFPDRLLLRSGEDVVFSHA
jgi:hypothetical protein